MNDDANTPGTPGTPGNSGNSGNSGNPGQNFDSGFITGELRHQQLSARVPESIARGVFSTGVVVLISQSEFVLDFLVRMARPHQIAARVVLPTAVMPSIIAVLRDNIQKYTERFGPIPQLPKPETDQRPTLQEVYDDLKMPDEILSGVYANGMMVGHSPAEFCFDFLTNFFPRSAVSCRVYLSAAHVPRMLESITQTFNNYQQRLIAARQQQILQQQRQQQQQPPPPPSDAPPTNPPQA